MGLLDPVETYSQYIPTRVEPQFPLCQRCAGTRVSQRQSRDDAITDHSAIHSETHSVPDEVSLTLTMVDATKSAP